VKLKRIRGDGNAQAAKAFKPTQNGHPDPRTKQTDPAPIRARTLLIEQYYVAVDRQLKSRFGTYEAAEKAAQEIKKRFPNPQVTVFDAKQRSHTTIEQQMASTKRRG
jgi:hypothetical protein